MTEIGQKLKTVLEGYAAFLRKRKSLLPRHQQHLVREVIRLRHYARRTAPFFGMLVNPFTS